MTTPLLVDRPKERVAFIQALRGIAALLVVWSHLSGFWLLTNNKQSALQNVWYEWVVAPFHIFQNGGHLGVVLFFLISGYIITHTSLRETRLEFAVKRVMRILPALVVALVISWLMLMVAAATGTDLLGIHGGSFLRWLSGAVLLDGFLPGGFVLDVTWTLVVEIIFYVITFALLSRSKRSPLSTTWIMAGIWVVLSVVSINVPQIAAHANGWASFYVGFLLIGRLIYLAQRRLIPVFDGVLLGSLLFVLYGLFVERVSPGYLLAPGGYKGLEPLVTYFIAFVAFLALMRWNPARAVPPFGFLGDISYSLYLLHLPIGITVLNLLALVHVPEAPNTVIAILVSIGVSWLSFRLIERPSQRWARSILRRLSRDREPGTGGPSGTGGVAVSHDSPSGDDPTASR
jgi:peptidoglycan/LPS O-acetylase OafA/YrhL